MNKREGAVSFLDGCIIEKDYVYLATKLDSLDLEDRYTRMFCFDDQIPEDTKKFYSHDLPDWRVVSVCVRDAHGSSLRAGCALSENGDVEYAFVGGTTTERIPGAGLPTPEEEGRGYVSKIRYIGNRLYVCGVGGQVYRRDDKAWQTFEDGLGQDASFADDAADMLVAGNLDALADMFDEMIVLNDINGLNEKDLYVVGDQGRIFHSKGKSWEPVACPTDETLVAIKCVSATEVWIAGYNGALLCGNWKDGFKDVSGIDGNDIFLSVEKYDDVIYIAGSSGVYTYKGKKIEKLKTGLTPEIEDAVRVEARDGRLWIFANKDLIYSDGAAWTRVVFLNNARLV